MSRSAREDILARIRRAVDGAPEVDIPRRYRATAEVGDLVGLFAERVGDYRAIVHVVPEAEVPARIAEIVAGRRMVVPEGLPAGWTPPDTSGAGPADPYTADGVVTGCAVAIAETGTIVLDTGPGQGSRAQTLVPDYHLCVVRADQIVAGVPEAVSRLDPARPLTWISGPSATSDIELNRVEGVHGPRTLEVLIATA
ncbi:LutC/YkgG family protein [Nonomuraea roseoviolacea]|uniref:L-lactate dehydrogenase complex protein LldG n=1 Tax=Nonomuraea roseoviolacea subsp. carminata TaxID=160689 RepID=A0ABT1K5W9_9ACTN|nr:LUD domain-containing protein [Nonomuraea roseoviolacea]MCP2349394.1 L-lactate dehydrogenase complex protein LldG [Nonomuraea roseoviolacea subsp. carminata]